MIAKSDVLKARFANKSVTYDDVRKSVASINIFYDEIKEIIVNQDIKMSPNDLLSQIGSNLGLFLGMSLLTAIELVEICLQFLVILIKYELLKK